MANPAKYELLVSEEIAPKTGETVLVANLYKRNDDQSVEKCHGYWVVAKDITDIFEGMAQVLAEKGEPQAMTVGLKGGKLPDQKGEPR